MDHLTLAIQRSPSRLPDSLKEVPSNLSSLTQMTHMTHCNAWMERVVLPSSSAEFLARMPHLPGWAHLLHFLASQSSGLGLHRTLPNLLTT